MQSKAALHVKTEQITADGSSPNESTHEFALSNYWDPDCKKGACHIDNNTASLTAARATP